MFSERQQRSLDEIENQLRLSDSRLASRFSLFAELVAGEEMPRREELPLTLRSRAGRLARFARPPGQAIGTGWPPAALLLLPVLLVVITCTLLLADTPHRGAACSMPRGPGSVIAGQPAPGQLAGWPPGCVSAQSAAHR